MSKENGLTLIGNDLIDAFAKRDESKIIKIFRPIIFLDEVYEGGIKGLIHATTGATIFNDSKHIFPHNVK